MDNERRNHREMIFEYMMPSCSWTEYSDFHCLRIDLPGFKKEEVRIRGDSYGNIIVSGERQANDTKIIHFEQSFKVPESCKIEDSSGILEDDTFCVTIPKNVTPNEAKDEIPNTDNNNSHNDDRDNKEEEEVHHSSAVEEWSERRSIVQKISRNFKKNRCILLTAFLSFSLGVVVSHRFQTTADVRRSKYT